MKMNETAFDTFKQTECVFNLFYKNAKRNGFYLRSRICFFL